MYFYTDYGDLIYEGYNVHLITNPFMQAIIFIAILFLTYCTVKFVFKR